MSISGRPVCARRLLVRVWHCCLESQSRYLTRDDVVAAWKRLGLVVGYRRNEIGIYRVEDRNLLT